MSRRIERINQLIKKELGRIFLEEFDLPRDILLTVMKVETTPDLLQAKIWLSVFPDSKRKEIFKILDKKKSKIRRFLGKKIALKIMPRLEFLVDKSEEKRDTINRLLKEIKNGTKKT